MERELAINTRRDRAFIEASTKGLKGKHEVDVVLLGSCKQRGDRRPRLPHVPSGEPERPYVLPQPVPLALVHRRSVVRRRCSPRSHPVTTCLQPARGSWGLFMLVHAQAAAIGRPSARARPEEARAVRSSAHFLE